MGLGTLVFVQPLLVASLLFSLVLGALVGTLRLTWADLGWAVVFMASLSIFLVVAAPSGGVDQRELQAWAAPLAVVAVLVLGALALSHRLASGYRAAAMAAAAGMTFGVSSTLMKSFAHLLGDDGVVDTLTASLGAVRAGRGGGRRLPHPAERVPGRRPARRVAPAGGVRAGGGGRARA